MRMLWVGVKANHTVCDRPAQNGSSVDVVALVTFSLTVKGMEGMTVGALKSSLGGGGGITTIPVTAVTVLPERLSPWKVTKKLPVMVGVQLNVAVLSPLSIKLAPAGTPVAVSTTWRDWTSVAVTVKVTFWFTIAFTLVGTVRNTMG